jgi:hypothetical protein
MGLEADVNWSLVEKTTQQYVEGAFPLDGGINLSASASLGEMPMLSREDPIVRWLGGNTTIITFDTMLFSTHRDDYIESDVDFLISLTKPWPQFNAAPICTFTYADFYIWDVLVESVGNVTFERPRPNIFSANLRTARFRMTLKKHIPYTVQEIPIPPSPRPEPLRKTRRRIVRKPGFKPKAGDQWDQLAKKHYGDPSLGPQMASQLGASYFDPPPKWTGSKLAAEKDELIAQQAKDRGDRFRVAEDYNKSGINVLKGRPPPGTFHSARAAKESALRQSLPRSAITG